MKRSLGAVAALSLCGCMATDPKPARQAPPLPEVEIFGTGDTLVYIGDSARFSLSLAPDIADVEFYRWRISSDGVSDTVDTQEPALARAWGKDQAGSYLILVGIKTRSRYLIEPFAFSIRVDSGVPELKPDTMEEFPFGAGNRFKVKARDPNGTLAKFYWSTKADTFTDSTDGPEWILPDTLLGYASIYCEARDDSGLRSKTLLQGIRVNPKTYGTLRDDFRGLAALPDGSLLAAGHTESFDTRKGEPSIAKIDAKGGMIARTTVKRSQDFGKYGLGYFHSLSPAGAGAGFVAAGFYRDSTQDDGLLAGIDAEGNVAWKAFIAADSGHQSFAASLQADAGHHIAVGYSIPDIRRRDTTFALLAAVDPAGAILFTKTFRHGNRLSFQSLAKTKDGNILVAAAGEGQAPGYGQAGWLYKLTPGGDSLWARPIGQFGLPAIDPQALVACRNGGFALLLNSRGQSQLVRLDEEGQVLWSKVLFTVKDEWIRGGTLIETAAGDFLLACNLPNPAQPSGIALFKYDAQGNLAWRRSLGTYSDYVYGLAELPSGGFAAAGSIGSTTAWIFRFDGNGKMEF